MSAKGWKKYSDKEARRLGAARLLLTSSFKLPGRGEPIRLILSDGKTKPKRFILTLSTRDLKRIQDLSYHPTEAPPEATRSQIRNLVYHGVIPSTWKTQEEE